jgi:tetratricopeptide (TPR) repeat protein
MENFVNELISKGEDHYAEAAQLFFHDLVDDKWQAIFPDEAPRLFVCELWRLLLFSIEKSSIKLYDQLEVVNILLYIDWIDYHQTLKAIKIIDLRMPHNNTVLGFYVRLFSSCGFYHAASISTRQIEEEQVVASLGIVSENETEAFYEIKDTAMIEAGTEVPKDNPLCLAMALRAEGRYMEANRLMDQAVASKPDYVPYLFHKGWFSMQLGFDDEAFKYFEKVKAAPEEDIQRNYFLPFIYVYYNQPYMAISMVEETLKEYPNDSWSLYAAAEIHSLLGNESHAYNNLKQAFAMGLSSRISLLSDPALKNLLKTSRGRKLVHDRIEKLEGTDLEEAIKIESEGGRASVLQCEEGEGGAVLCKVPIMGNEISFFVDTGTVETIVKCPHVYATESLDYVVKNESINNWNISEMPFPGQYATIPGLEGEPLEGTPAIVPSLRFGINILGMASLARFKRIALHGSLMEKQCIHIPFKWIDSMICITCEITMGAVFAYDSSECEDATINCIIDSGSSGNLIPLSYMNELYKTNCEDFVGYEITLHLNIGNSHSDIPFVVHNSEQRPLPRLGLSFINSFQTFIIDTEEMEISITEH